ncbi:hypothetical protein DFH09DRAFT_1113514 [Mycena vulgaris]|nr:hypothetical protein DFH09DRAFT_1113514 [Mycena vulgaris]
MRARWLTHYTRNLLTPPSTPQRHQQRTRESQRELRASEDGSPRRRRIPNASAGNNENEDPNQDSANFRARSRGQIRRRERERRRRGEHSDEPPPQTTRSLAQQARRARERAEKEAQSRMDIDATAARPLQPSRVLQALTNGPITPPATQRAPQPNGAQVVL